MTSSASSLVQCISKGQYLITVIRMGAALKYPSLGSYFLWG